MESKNILKHWEGTMKRTLLMIVITASAAFASEHNLAFAAYSNNDFTYGASMRQAAQNGFLGGPQVFASISGPLAASNAVVNTGSYPPGQDGNILVGCP
jgi:hypothetical protein